MGFTKMNYNLCMQKIIAYNNNNMCNPSLHFTLWGYACCYCCMPSSPVLLHIYCPHPLSCCIYTALIPCLAAYILPSSPVLLYIYCPCFSTFWHCHPYILQHLMEMFLHVYLHTQEFSLWIRRKSQWKRM